MSEPTIGRLALYFLELGATGTVTEVDGAPIAPLNLTPVNASIGFNLLSNPGVAQPWSLGLTMDIASQLTTLGVPHTVGATRIEVAINDTLVALSESSSAAFAAKKDFRVDVVTEVAAIPELNTRACSAPSTAASFCSTATTVGFS